MFKTITSKIKRDTDYPLRQYTIDMLTRVLDGKIYDHLEYDFNTEKKDGIGEYIPIRDRRPSVRYGLCKVVVDDSVSLLFSEGHFPSIGCNDEKMRETLADIIKETKLNEVMVEAATIGSVGSVAILMRVLEGRVFFEAFNTMFMKPTWKATAPDTLEKVTEKYKVKGEVLIETGYTECKKEKTYWFQRIWDEAREIWYTPWDVSDENASASEDTTKTTTHDLGFVPIVWAKNLPGGDKIDGKPTFPNETIDTQIEIDYQLSQAGRGLKYSSDPTLLLKEPAIGNDGQVIKGGGNAIVVRENGDAKMLEINGTASTAVIEYVRCLRELALESAHGNRANADKISAAQSGRAMELMNQALIWLADKLRTSYGEGALLSLLKMVVKASAKYELMVDGVKAEHLDPANKITLLWPAWYQPTSTDMESKANTNRTLVDAGIISLKSATQDVADMYDIEDVEAERKQADKELADREAAAKKTVSVQAQFLVVPTDPLDAGFFIYGGQDA